MKFLLLFFLFQTSGQAPDCSWLKNTFTYNSNILSWTTYKGTCCKTQAVNYLNEKYLNSWKTVVGNNDRGGYVDKLNKLGLCGPEASTPKPTSTSTPTTSTTSLPSIATTTTSPIQCGPLAGTSCCTLAITECLTGKHGIDWLKVPSVVGYDSQLTDCGCVLETSSTSTVTPTSTASYDCKWLSKPFNYTVDATFPPYNVSYFGTCCSETSVNTLTDNGLAWLLDAPNEAYNKWVSLTTLLYCTPGACTDPPLWTNCSFSSTSSSSSLSTTSIQSDSTVTTSQMSSTSTESSTMRSTDTSTSGSSTGTTGTTESTGTSGTSGSTMESTTVTSSAPIIFSVSSEATTVTSTTTATVTSVASEASTGSTAGSTVSSTNSEATSSTSSPPTSHSTDSTSPSTTVTSTVTPSTSLVSSLASSISTAFSTILTTVTTPFGSTGTGTMTTPSTSLPTTESGQTTVTGSSQSTATTGTTSVPLETTTTSKAASTETSLPGMTNDPDVVYRNTSVELFPNCTKITVVYSIYTNNTVLRNTTVEFDACSTTSPLTTPTTPEATTTYNWPTGGTTRMLPSGEIVISESLITYENCTTVLMQLIYNPSTNTTRTEITTDPEGCTTTSTTPMTTTPMPTSHSTTPSSTVHTTTYNWPTGGTTRVLPSGEIVLSESLVAYENCTTVLMQLIYNPSANQTRTETTTDPQGCKTTSTTPSTSKQSTTTMPSSSAKSSTSQPSTTPSSTVKTTTYNWPTGGTTRVLPSGDIILSESLISYANCTTVLRQLIYTPSTNQTRTETTTDAYGCKVSSSTSSKTTTPKPSTSTTAKPTTTFPWPTGGTTRTLPSGEIIISESLVAYENCTTVLMQLIYNPKTNTTRTETTSDAQGCKATSTTLKPTAPPTTTFAWPTGGTTKVLPSGEIIISESLTAYNNCTTVLMQLIYNPATNTTRTETTSDAEGCKATSTTPKPTTAATTTFSWPTGGTTKVLPSGEIIISESLNAYKNCTTVLLQLIYNPKTNTTRTETTSDAQGCKAASPTTRAPISSTTAPGTQTTTYNWPTGGTTKVLPSGEIILSESLTAYKNCTTVLLQLIYNPTTNTTRTETTSDAQGCKATSSSSSRSSTSQATTPMVSTATTTFEWPTGGTTRTLPSGEIILSESLTAYPNCTTTLRQLIYNPATNTTRTETMSDAQGCKATTSSAKPTGTTPMMTTTAPITTEAPFTFPESKTTQILPSGEIILSESLTAYPNCTTTLRQLIYNPTTKTTRTETMSDAQGCKATTTTKASSTSTSPPTSSTTPAPSTTPTYCPALKLDMSNTLRPTFNEVKGTYAIGEQVVHLCKKRYAFEYALQPLKIYQCTPNGKWAGTPEKCILTRKSEL